MLAGEEVGWMSLSAAGEGTGWYFIEVMGEGASWVLQVVTQAV